MKAYYELWRERTDKMDVQRNSYTTFFPHFHNNVEILIAKKNAHVVYFNGKRIEVPSGSVVFFDSYDFHGYEKLATTDRDDCVVIIPFKYLERFNVARRDLRAKNPVTVDIALANSLMEIVDRVLLKEKNELVLRCAIDMFLALINTRFEFTEKQYGTETELIKNLLGYICENFRNDIPLSLLAKKVGYTETHVSRTFHKYMKIGIPEYVNNLRLEYVFSELKKGGKKVTEVIFNAGFKSIQSYYRNKLRYEKNLANNN